MKMATARHKGSKSDTHTKQKNKVTQYCKSKHAPLYVLILPSHLQLVTIPDSVMKLLLTSNASVLFLEGEKQSCYCSPTAVLIQMEITIAEMIILSLHTYGFPSTPLTSCLYINKIK
jgi:hypothetical protein